MEYLFFVATTFAIFLPALCQQCPAPYLRYSKDHSFCKPINPTCPIFYSGVTKNDIIDILSLHNRYRSFVALGKERNAGGMPAAADMLQMVWDGELAAVAQRRAEQCIYAHDCNVCRKVENFDVGQNIAYREKVCVRPPCNIYLNKVPDWQFVIKMFYDEVSLFNKNYVSSVVFEPGKEYGHFTAMVWAKTWGIGCGYVAFRKEGGYRQLYVCNYGPGGNIPNEPMYKIGRPCSACPINSCCGNSCKHPVIPGLCRMDRNDQAPIYRKKENYIFYCDFSSPRGDCSTISTGINKWRYINALGGSFAEIILNGGQTSTLEFKTTIRPKQNFCVVVLFRKGPTVDGARASSTAVVNFQMPKAQPSSMKLPDISSQQFFQYRINLSWSYDTKVSLTFSVPRGAPPQYLNIQMVTSKIGKC